MRIGHESKHKKNPFVIKENQTAVVNKESPDSFDKHVETNYLTYFAGNFVAPLGAIYILRVVQTILFKFINEKPEYKFVYDSMEWGHDKTGFGIYTLSFQNDQDKKTYEVLDIIYESLNIMNKHHAVGKVNNDRAMHLMNKKKNEDFHDYSFDNLSPPKKSHFDTIEELFSSEGRTFSGRGNIAQFLDSCSLFIDYSELRSLMFEHQYFDTDISLLGTLYYMILQEDTELLKKYYSVFIENIEKMQLLDNKAKNIISDTILLHYNMRPVIQQSLNKLMPDYPKDISENSQIFENEFKTMFKEFLLENASEKLKNVIP